MINGTPRILIIRLSSIGDVVRVLPALHVLREAYPEARIDWVVEQKSSDIVEGHQALDKLIVFKRPSRTLSSAAALWAIGREIRKNDYDIVLDFHGILKSGILTALSLARKRYGFARPRGREGSWLFLNHRVALSSDRLNRVEENLALCAPLAPAARQPNVTMYVPPDVQDEVDKYFEQAFEGAKLVVAVHAPIDREEKLWSAEYFAELADRLLADGRFDVLLTWGPGQFDAVEAVLAKTRRNPIVAPQTSNLKHYAWLVHRADLYFGGDTGPMHIAALMGTPVVAVFGGTDPAKHAPYRHPHEALCVDDTASYPISTKVAQERLRRITPEMAYDACVRLALKTRGHNETPPS